MGLGWQRAEQSAVVDYDRLAFMPLRISVCSLRRLSSWPSRGTGNHKSEYECTHANHTHTRAHAQTHTS